MKWSFDKYSSADGDNSMTFLANWNLKGILPATIIAAQYNPLRSEGQMLADNLKKADVKTNGITHEFFDTAARKTDANDAEGFAALDLKDAF
jgi:acetyl esterase